MACPNCGCKETHTFDADGGDLCQSDDRLERCAACRHVFDVEDHADEDDDTCPECDGDGDGRDKWNDYLLPCPACSSDVGVTACDASVDIDTRDGARYRYLRTLARRDAEPGPDGRVVLEFSMTQREHWPVIDAAADLDCAVDEARTAGVPVVDRVQRLMDACEGEVGGLALPRAAARRILAFVDGGTPALIAEAAKLGEEAPAGVATGHGGQQ
jgi:hypothetical protein